MKYCQGPSCHEHKTKDRIRGHKGDKHYETRKRSSFYYGKSNFCSLNCQNDWFNKFGDMAVDHFGRIHEPKRTTQVARGIRHMIGEVMVMIVITLLMIYLANADQLHKHNTMTRTSHHLIK